MIVAINSSGGGSDKGLSGNGIVEKDYTLELSKKINDRLKNMGIKTYMLRDDDSTTSYEKRLSNLKNYAKNDDVLLLSNTLNNNNGIDIIYSLRDTYAIADAVAMVIGNYVGVSKQPSKDNIYIVKSGDTLYSIAKKFNISVDNLKSINNLNSNLIKINQELKIPNKTIIIKKGDTLYSIAKNNNTSVDKLMSINNLKNSNLAIGDVLYLP